MLNKWNRKLGLGISAIMVVSQLSTGMVFAASENEEFGDRLEDKFEDAADIEESRDDILWDEEDIVFKEPDQPENTEEWIYITKMMCEFTSSIQVGESRPAATFEPVNFTEPVYFSSSNEDVLTVDEQGIMTGVSQGTAGVTIEYGSSAGTIHVAVLAGNTPQVLIYDYGWADSNVDYPGTMQTTYPYDFRAKVFPEDQEYKIVWSSEDETKAAMSEDGIVTGLEPGTVRIKAAIFDGDTEISADYYSIDFDVVDVPYDPNNIRLRSASVPGGKIVLGINEVVNPWQYDPENYTENIFFFSGDPAIATVDQEGNVKGIAVGHTEVIIWPNEEQTGGSRGGAHIYVTDGQPHVYVRAPELCWVDIRNTDHMDADIVSGSDEYNVIWESSDDSIATIDQNGDIVYRRGGLVKFYAKIEQLPDVTDCIVRIVCAGVLDKIIGAAAADEEIINDVVELIRPEGTDEINQMREAIEESEEAKESLKTLEETYNTRNNIEVNENSDVAEIPTNEVEIIGAGLNALEENTNLNLEILSVDEDDIVDPSGHSDIIGFDMSLYVDENNQNEVDITIPVVVTLPVPETVDIESMEMLHISDNGDTEIIVPTLTDDGTGVVLTLSHFSTFAFVWNSEDDQSEDTTWQKEYEYELSGTDIVVSRYVGDSKDITLPAKAVINGTTYQTVIDSSDTFVPVLTTSFSVEEGVKARNLTYMFKECTELQSVDLKGLDTSAVEQYIFMFYKCTSLQTVDLSGFDGTAAKNLSGMFAACGKLQSIDFSKFGAKNVNNLTNLFDGCENLAKVDLSGIDTSNVKGASMMFKNCKAIQKIDLSGFDLANMQFISDMFIGCDALVELKTPINLPADLTAKLSKSYIEESSGTEYSELPHSAVSYTLIEKGVQEADKKAAEAVDAAIQLIGSVTYTNESKEKIETARTAYDALTDEQKRYVTTLETLAMAEEEYTKLKTEAEQETADKEAATVAENAIKAIGAVDNTEECKAKIDAARTAYNKLTDVQKKLVSNLSVLTAAEDEVARLESIPMTGTALVENKDGSRVYYRDGEARLDYSGLAETKDGWYYVENGIVAEEKAGFITYDGSKFFLVNGKVDITTIGLVQDIVNTDDWYYCAEGQVVSYTGLTVYDEEWFYVENGKLDITKGGFVEYDGSMFFVAAGQIARKQNFLTQDPNTGKWYYLAEGQVVDVTTLAQYDGAWFYIIKGKLAEEYTGTVEYNGAEFNVVNGMVR